MQKNVFSTECQVAADIAFLMDGSGSVDNRDFSKMKDFVINLINSLQGKYMKVGLLHLFLCLYEVSNFIWTTLISVFRRSIKSSIALSLQFAIAQYSGSFRTFFDFKSFNTNPGWENKIRQIAQFQGGTNTAAAITRVV